MVVGLAIPAALVVLGFRAADQAQLKNRRRSQSSRRSAGQSRLTNPISLKNNSGVISSTGLIAILLIPLPNDRLKRLF